METAEEDNILRGPGTEQSCWNRPSLTLARSLAPRLLLSNDKSLPDIVDVADVDGVAGVDDVGSGGGGGGSEKVFDVLLFCL